VPPTAVFPSGCSLVIELAASLADLIRNSQAQGADLAHRSRNRKPKPSSDAIRQEAKLLKAKGKTWREVAELIWTAHPEWFPDDPSPEELRPLPAQRAELVSLIRDRVRHLCKKPSTLED